MVKADVLSLGLIQPFIQPAKQLLQEACKRSLRWDNDLSDLPGLGMQWEKMVTCIATAGKGFYKT